MTLKFSRPNLAQGLRISLPISAVYEEHMIPYKGYLIRGKAVRVHPTSPEWWRSQGGVFSNDPGGSMHIKHLDEGFIFESKKAAEAHGLKLCKKWIDENVKSIDDV